MREGDEEESPMQSPQTDQTLNKLNDCLRSERSAVDTYSLALKHADKPEVTATLTDIRESHEARSKRISEFLRSRGVEPAKSGGAWGVIAKAVQSGANLFGDVAAVTSLEEFEDYCLKMYSEGQYSPDVRQFVDRELLPEEQRTHEMCRDLKRFIA
jgi:hypothetical protein